MKNIDTNIDTKATTTTQEQRQQLLEKLLSKEMARMKKLFFPRQHRTLLKHNIEIIEADLTKFSASGIYEKVQEQGKSEYHYTHKISINTRDINEYLNYKRHSWCKFFNKKYYKRQLTHIIRHELCHAWVNDYYGLWTELEGVHKDSSPIFLAVLQYVEGISCYNFIKAYKKSEIHEKVKEIKTFTELDVYLTELILEYQKVTRELKETNTKDVHDNFVLLSNNFYFAGRDAGLHKRLQNKSELVFKDIQTQNWKKIKSETNSFEIGCCIMPRDIPKLVNKKRCNGGYEYKSIKKTLCTHDKKLIDIYRDESDIFKEVN